MAEKRHVSALAQNRQRCFDMSVCGTMHKVTYELQMRLTFFESIENTS